MELEDFIAHSLRDIVNGVKAAQEAVGASGAYINPEFRRIIPAGTSGSGLVGWSRHEGGLPILTVDFDVAVTATEGTGTKGGIGVVAGIVTLGSQGRSEQASATASRIRFTIPVLLPSAGRAPEA